MERYRVGCTGWLIENPRDPYVYWLGGNTWGPISSRTDIRTPCIFLTKTGASLKARQMSVYRKIPVRVVRARDAERKEIARLHELRARMEHELATAKPGNRVEGAGWYESIIRAIDRELAGFGEQISMEAAADAR
jgi:hypothetical protein